MVKNAQEGLRQALVVLNKASSAVSSIHICMYMHAQVYIKSTVTYLCATYIYSKWWSCSAGGEEKFKITSSVIDVKSTGTSDSPSSKYAIYIWSIFSVILKEMCALLFRQC